MVPAGNGLARRQQAGRAPGRRTLACVLLGLVCLLSGLASAGTPIYAYTDDEGVVHFSSFPRDRRYQPYEIRASGRRVTRVPRQSRFCIST